MYKFLILLTVVMGVSSCGGKSFDTDEIYDILAQEEGAVAGINIGDEWSATIDKFSGKLEKANTTEALFIDYGSDETRFRMMFDVEGDIVTGFEVVIQDVGKNNPKMYDLEGKLKSYFSSRPAPVNIWKNDQIEDSYYISIEVE